MNPSSQFLINSNTSEKFIWVFEFNGNRNKIYFCYLGSSSSSGAVMGPGGAPNRPLPPTPDEEESGDRTLVLRRVSVIFCFIG